VQDPIPFNPHFRHNAARRIRWRARLQSNVRMRNGRIINFSMILGAGSLSHLARSGKEFQNQKLPQK